MPLTTDMTTIRVLVAITTPRSVRKERNLWLRSAAMATQKASRAVTHTVMRWRFFSTWVVAQKVAPVPRGCNGSLLSAPRTEPRPSGAVKKWQHAGESPAPPNSNRMLAMVGQAIRPPSPACGRFFHSFSGSGPPPSELKINERDRSVHHAENLHAEEHQRQRRGVDPSRRVHHPLEPFLLLFRHRQQQSDPRQSQVPGLQQHAAGSSGEHLLDHVQALRQVGGAEEDPA